jgi:hypothetical protein
LRTVLAILILTQWYALAPLISRDVYGGTGVFGVLESVAGVGAVCGALAGLKWHPARPLVCCWCSPGRYRMPCSASVRRWRW